MKRQSAAKYFLKMDENLSYDNFILQITKIYKFYLENKGSTTISKESTTQANGVGKGELPKKEEDIVSSM